jgi:hypothetical protein
MEKTKGEARITASHCNCDVTQDTPLCILRYFDSEKKKKKKKYSRLSRHLHNYATLGYHVTTHPTTLFVTECGGISDTEPAVLYRVGLAVKYMGVQCNTGP